jgi:hypothetical protein
MSTAATTSSTVPTDLATLLQEGWRDHDKETEAVAARLEGAVPRAEKPEHAAGILHLGNHAIGQHLGDWPRAARLGERMLAHWGARPATAGMLASVAVARHLVGDVAGALATEARAAALAPAEAASALLRTRLLVAEGMLATGRGAEAGVVLDAALELAAALPKDAPIQRMVAVSTNSVASELMERPSRTPDEDARMLRAAHASRRAWLAVGDWTNDERADYLLALVSLAAGSPADAVLHAERALTTIQRGGEEPVDAAFVNLALARAYRGLGLASEHAAALAEADRLAAGFADPGIRSWYDGEAAKAR